MIPQNMAFLLISGNKIYPKVLSRAMCDLEDGEGDFKVKRMSSTFGILRAATVYRERICGMKRKNLFFEADCKSQRTAKAPNT